MLLEQEIASIINFTLKNAGDPTPYPYYYDVPQSFQYPAMFFPQPEITTRGETLNTYAMLYSWYINVFCRTTEDAAETALNILTAIKRKRNLIPLIDEKGYCGKGLRVDDPSINKVDNGVYQITIEWTSRRPYDAEVVQKMMRYETNMYVVEDLRKAYWKVLKELRERAQEQDLPGSV